MHIFYTRGSGDPMLLDTKEGLHSLGAQLRSFLESSAESGRVRTAYHFSLTLVLREAGAWG